MLQSPNIYFRLLGTHQTIGDQPLNSAATPERRFLRCRTRTTIRVRSGPTAALNTPCIEFSWQYVCAQKKAKHSPGRGINMSSVRSGLSKTVTAVQMKIKIKNSIHPITFQHTLN
jgi:hypothetical protein